MKKRQIIRKIRDIIRRKRRIIRTNGTTSKGREIKSGKRRKKTKRTIFITSAEIRRENKKLAEKEAK